MPLINSDLWKDSFVPLKQLHFHPSNPRLPEIRGAASEAEVIHELCQRADVQRLARTITERGYFRHDRLIVHVEDQKNIVYEGNRRLCALKLLHNWKMAPAHLHRTFKGLSEKAQLPKKIAVEIVPNKFHAEVVMYSKHVDEAFTVKWDKLQQATFIATKLDGGETVDSLMTTYALSRDNIIDARATLDLYRLSVLAELSPKAQALVDDPGQFPYSTVFERLFKPVSTRKLLGATIDESGLSIASTEEQFLPVLARILDDAAEQKINTRTLNDVKAQENYVKKLGFKPKGGRITAEEIEARRAGQATHQPPSANAANAPTPKRSVRPTTKLLPSSIVLGFPHEKIAQLVAEGKKIDTALAHTAASLLRVILETALAVKLRSLKHYGRINAANSKMGPTLAEMLDYVNTNHTAVGLDAGGKRAVEALVSKYQKESKFQLDRIVHNPAVLATPAEVVQIRESALPLLTELLK